MSGSSSQELTSLLRAWRHGKPESMEQILPVVYKELRRLAHRHMIGQRADHTLQTTALINEAYLRLLDCREVNWQDRTHFFAVTSQMMRRILVDYARARHYQKRGGGLQKVSLDERQIVSDKNSPSLVALDDALRALAELDPRKSLVVEMRFFGGMSVEETAEALGVSKDTVMRDWKLAKAWLAREMNNSATDNS